MPYSSTTHAKPPVDPLLIVEEFFDISYTYNEANRLLYKMNRAAFAHKSWLTKRDIQDLVYFKEQLAQLLEAANQVGQHKKKHRFLAECSKPCDVLERAFRQKKLAEWMFLLERIFNAAIYDGFFVAPPEDNDIYHCCHCLHRILNACYGIHKCIPAMELYAPFTKPKK